MKAIPREQGGTVELAACQGGPDCIAERDNDSYLQIMTVVHARETE